MVFLASAGGSIWSLVSPHALIYSVGQVFNDEKSNFDQNIFFYFFRSNFQFLCSFSIKMVIKSKTRHSQVMYRCWATYD